MDATQMYEVCARLPGAWPDHPWGHEHPVFKVGPPERSKIFAFLSADTVGVKAATTREVADEWLERYPDDASVMAYVGRSGWNDLVLGGAIPDDELIEAVEESYRLVVSKLLTRDRPAEA